MPVSATTVTAVTPARAAGTVDVDVVTASGTYTLRNAFTYGGCTVTVGPSSVAVSEAAAFQGPPIHDHRAGWMRVGRERRRPRSGNGTELAGVDSHGR